MKTVLRRQPKLKAILLQKGTEWKPAVVDSGDEHGGRISPEAGSKKRAGKGTDHKGQAIPQAGVGYEPAVGGEILTGDDKGHDALSAMAGVIVFSPARGFVSSRP